MSVRSESREEYLEAIFKLAQQPEGATVSRVADELGLAAPSVSQMVARLAGEGLIERDPASRVLLTREGRREALRLVRRHRLSERFLTDYLDLPWDQVHDEACKFEHVLSDEVEERLAAHLGNPQTCPHGRAIPSADGELPDEPARPLAELCAGQKSTISFVSDEQPDAPDLGFGRGRRPLWWAAAGARGPRPLRARPRGGRQDLRAGLSFRWRTCRRSHSPWSGAPRARS
ncbi:MAG: metal-dependent transcriptional regulator, partial [Thermoleophilia bacterium]